MKVEPLTHTCTVAGHGNKHSYPHTQTVSSYDVELGTQCDECGEVLATREDLALHLYRELVE